MAASSSIGYLSLLLLACLAPVVQPATAPPPTKEPSPKPPAGSLLNVNVTLYVTGNLGGKPLTLANFANNSTTARGLGRNIVQVGHVFIPNIIVVAAWQRTVMLTPCTFCKPNTATTFFLEYHITYPTAKYASQVAKNLNNAGKKLVSAILKSPSRLSIQVYDMRAVTYVK